MIYQEICSPNRKVISLSFDFCLSNSSMYRWVWDGALGKTSFDELQIQLVAFWLKNLTEVERLLDQDPALAGVHIGDRRCDDVERRKNDDDEDDDDESDEESSRQKQESLLQHLFLDHMFRWLKKMSEKRNKFYLWSLLEWILSALSKDLRFCNSWSPDPWKPWDGKKLRSLD